MARYGLTVGYEKDTCSICGYEKEIRVVYDKEESKIVKVCDACLNDLGDKTVHEIIQEHGKKTDAKDIRILTKEQMEKSGFELTGKKMKKGEKSE